MKENTKSKNKISSEEKFELQDFDLFKALEEIDKKNYSWINSLTEEQKKKFVPYMMLYWISSIKGNPTLSSYYLMSVEHHANKYYFNESITDHEELQWLMLCASSPGIGKQFHQWIPHLNLKFGMLKEAVTLKEASDYFAKIYNADSNILKELAKEYVNEQNHNFKLGKMYPEMKLQDIQLLSKLTSKEEIAEYERESGIT